MKRVVGEVEMNREKENRQRYKPKRRQIKEIKRNIER